ncbi:MAG: methionine biosynthesis protein MetW, partial [Arenicellales bacterium]
MSLSRSDFQVICDWIKPNSRVLDLGCGNGELLQELSINQGVSGYGIEIDDKNISQCIKAGINVIQRDLDLGLSDFDEDSF